jgi:hypothetical protein
VDPGRRLGRAAGSGLVVLGCFLVRDRRRLAQTWELFTEAVGAATMSNRRAG